MTGSARTENCGTARALGGGSELSSICPSVHHHCGQAYDCLDFCGRAEEAGQVSLAHSYWASARVSEGGESSIHRGPGSEEAGPGERGPVQTWEQQEACGWRGFAVPLGLASLRPTTLGHGSGQLYMVCVGVSLGDYTCFCTHVCPCLRTGAHVCKYICELHVLRPWQVHVPVCMGKDKWVSVCVCMCLSVKGMNTPV